MAGRRYSEWVQLAAHRRPIGIAKAADDGRRKEVEGAGIHSGATSIRGANRRVVLQLFKAHGSMSRADAARLSGLTKPTVSAIVDDLVARRILREDGPGRSSPQGGRPAAILRLDPRFELVLAAHIGVNRTTVALADSLGDIVARREFKTRRDDADAALAAVAKAAHELIAIAAVDPAAVLFLQVALPGMTDSVSGICHWAPNLGWQEVAVGSVLERSLGIRVAVRNVVQVVALAETLQGTGRAFERALVVYEDDGIGAAFVSEGQVAPGCHGVFGEIGHARLPGFDAPCGCGGRGCFEAVASSRALKASLAEFDPALLSRNSYADHGHANPAIAARVDEVARLIGTVTSWLINLYGPDAVIFSGGFLEGNDGFLQRIEQTALSASLPLLRSRLSVRHSSIQFDGAVRGAISLALEQIAGMQRGALAAAR